MSDRYLDDLLPDFGEYSLESVLEEYSKRGAAPVAADEDRDGDTPPPAAPSDQAQAPSNPAQAIARRSRHPGTSKPISRRSSPAWRRPSPSVPGRS